MVKLYVVSESTERPSSLWLSSFFINFLRRYRHHPCCFQDQAEHGPDCPEARCQRRLSCGVTNTDIAPDSHLPVGVVRFSSHPGSKKDDAALAGLIQCFLDVSAAFSELLSRSV